MTSKGTGKVQAMHGWGRKRDKRKRCKDSKAMKEKRKDEGRKPWNAICGKEKRRFR